MFTGITSRAGALLTTLVALTGAPVLCGGPAAADPNQDDQFLALLDQEQIPAVVNAPSLFVTAHKVCRRLDDGTPVADLVDVMRNNAYKVDPTARQYPPTRVTTTMTRFITAAVEAYCPYDQRKIASIMANPTPGSDDPAHGVAASAYGAVSSGSESREPPPALGITTMPAASREPAGTGALRLWHAPKGGVVAAVPAGEITPPDPPEIPPPPPPAARILAPPAPVAAPPPPRQPPPPPQQPPPPPQEVQPPVEAPQPGGAGGGDGGDGNGDNGGGGPAEPAPAMPPGFVRIAP